MAKEVEEIMIPTSFEGSKAESKKIFKKGMFKKPFKVDVDKFQTYQSVQPKNMITDFVADQSASLVGAITGSVNSGLDSIEGHIPVIETDNKISLGGGTIAVIIGIVVLFMFKPIRKLIFKK